MKVETRKPKFKPISITLETEEEVEMMKMISLMRTNSLTYCGGNGSLEFTCDFMVWCGVHDVDDFLDKIKQGIAAAIKKE